MTDENSTITPTGITHDRTRRMLLITWNDGHESQYPLDELRAACPCVVCRGGHENMGQEHEPDILTLTPVESFELRDMQLAGNYALQLWWDDGHSSGIYGWPYLRRICFCDTCMAERRLRE